MRSSYPSLEYGRTQVKLFYSTAVLYSRDAAVPDKTESLEEIEKRVESQLNKYEHDIERLRGLLAVVAKRFYSLASELKKRIKGQDEYINALINGLASREHVALISPPGTAKSYAVRLLQQMIDGANLYTALFNPYLSYDQVFGPIDIAELRKGRVVRKWGNIIKAHLAFLDEGFKANPALLNSLLSWLNERVVYDPYSGEQLKVPLITAVIASNEVPTEESLRALWDRIAIRVYGKYLQSPELLTEALYATLEHRAKPSKIVKVDDIVLFHRLLDRVLQPGHPLSKRVVQELARLKNYDIVRLLHTMVIVPLFNLRQEFGEDVLLSDRTIISKMPRIWLASTLILRNHHIQSYSMLEALRQIHMYAAGDEDTAERVKEYFDKHYGKVYNIAKSLDKASAMMITLIEALKSGIVPANINELLEKIKEQLDNAAEKLAAQLGYEPLELAKAQISPPASVENIRDVITFILYVAKKDYENLARILEQLEAYVNKLSKTRPKMSIKQMGIPGEAIPS